jgi:RNA-directed DNA polymerase
MDIRDVIVAINPILRGWGNYFRTGDAAIKFVQIDRYVVSRLCGLMTKRRGRHLRPGPWRERGNGPNGTAPRLPMTVSAST